MKFLLWFVIGALVFYWATRAGRLAERRQRASDSAARRAAAAGPDMPGKRADRDRFHAGAGTESLEAEDMLQCAHCGMHVPASEALIATAGQAYCSAAHRQLHAPR